MVQKFQYTTYINIGGIDVIMLTVSILRNGLQNDPIIIIWRIKMQQQISVNTNTNCIVLRG